MFPSSYAAPIAVFFIVGGLLSCFAGYRLFRVVLGIYGFMLGAAITTTWVGSGHGGTFALVLAAVVGGLVGAVLMVAAYFVGVGLVGAGLAALVLNVGWHALRHTDPPTGLLVVFAVLGALLALSVVRYVVVFGTALAGSWTAILGALALSSPAALRAASAPDTWVVYPSGPIPFRWWMPIAWLAVALGGIIVQLSTTTKTAGPKRAKPKKA
jgi:uncharacterized protein DUF4203